MDHSRRHRSEHLFDYCDSRQSVFLKTPRCASGALVDHRAAFHLIGHWRVAISCICVVQVGFLGVVPAFLRSCRMAVGCGDGVGGIGVAADADDAREE